MKPRTSQNQPKPPSKGQMLDAIERAIAKMEKPFEVRLTPKARRDLMRPANYAYLSQAYNWSQYILYWEYGKRMQSDNVDDDYRELIHVLERMYADKAFSWTMKE